MFTLILSLSLFNSPIQFDRFSNPNLSKHWLSNLKLNWNQQILAYTVTSFEMIHLGSVTKWPDLFFNIWWVTSLKMCTIALKIFFWNLKRPLHQLNPNHCPIYSNCFSPTRNRLNIWLFLYKIMLKNDSNSLTNNNWFLSLP